MPAGTGSQSSALRIAEFGECAEPMPAHDAIAELEAGDAGADRDDLARPLIARDKRRVGPELVFAGEHQHVDILRAARPDAHLHLARTGRLRVRHLPQGQHLGPPERLAYDCFHSPPP